MDPTHARTRGLALASLALLTGLVAAPLSAQQVPDTLYRPEVPRPAWETGGGPRLCLDEAHHNFHTLEGRFWAFGELARRDGYRVGPLRVPFSSAAFSDCDLLVISNAQWSAAPWSQYPAPTPSAFTAGEILAIREWVERGGALLLIADHMPLAGAARDLAAALGAEFIDGFAFQRSPVGAPIDAGRGVPTLFLRADGSLADHPVTRGRDPTERISQVRSFTGQAFRMTAPTFAPILTLPADFISLEPRIAWQFETGTPIRDVGNWLQGATLSIGRGRVALFGEAAMFSAQVSGPDRTPMGMNAPMAEENPRFVLNVLHWLSGVLDR